MRRVFLFLLLFCLQLSANYIKNYRIDAFLESDGTYLAKEKIEYFFGFARHGIYRDIPLFSRVNNKEYNLHLQVEDVLMDNGDVPYQKINIYDNGKRYLRVKIGSFSYNLQGLHTFEITYKARVPIIALKKSDRVSINLIGTLWKVPTQKAQILLHLPFSKENFRFRIFRGYYKSQKRELHYYWLDEYTLVIEGSNLAPLEGITIDLFFQKGLMNLPKNSFKFFYLLLFLPLFFYIKELFNKFQGVHFKRALTPFYAPPKGIDVLEAATILKELKSQNLAAAIIELATKGKISITYDGETPILRLKNKDKSNLDKTLSTLLELLFAKGDTLVLEKSQNMALFLQESFKQIQDQVQEEVVKKNLFLESPKESKKHFIEQTLWVMIPLALWSIVYLYNNFDFSFFFVLLFPIIFGIVAISLLSQAQSKMEYFIGAFFFLGGLIPILSYGDDILYSPVALFLLSLYFIAYFYQKIGLYTPKGARFKWQLLGLKEFIKRVKKDEIKRFLQEDPLYLDKLLPYAMLFGLSRHWLKHYIDFNLQPFWFDGSDLLMLETFESDFASISAMNEENGFDDFGGAGEGSLGGGGGDW